MKQKIAFFDFDDTIIHGDSIKYLLTYYVKKHPLSIFNFLKVGWYYMGHKLGNQPINKTKSAILFPLDKMSNQDLQTFYQKMVVPRYYSNVVQELMDKRREGYYVYIVSASVEAYLQYCDLPVDCIMGTKVEQVNGKYTSHMIGTNCKKEEKVKRIYEDLKKKGMEIDYEQSYAYSDSEHDIPMLKLVKNRIRINVVDGSMTAFIIKD